MSFHKHVLPNGLTIVGEISPSARSVAVGFFIKTGARDETPAESGVSHFLEHMVFKGTPHRSALEVNLDFDKIGADYNAGTSEETTSFYALVLPEYLAQAVEILADILRPSLRSEDFEMEKKVIIEEIGMYDDSPGWCAYDNARKAYFADHPLGNSVLGTKESITALSRDQMQAYFDRRYVASNITVAVAGNFHWDDAVEVIDKHCGLWPTGTASRPIVKPAEPRRLLKVITKEKLNQEQAYLLAPAPAADSIQRYAADALAMIIGDSSGSRLYWALIDPGLAESADMNFQDHEGTGTYFISFSCEPENTQNILAIIQEILREVQNEGVSDEELAVAKSKILSRVVRSSERPKGRMQALGIGWTYLRTYRSVDEELQNFDAVSLKDIRNVLDQYPFDQLTVLALGPLAKLE
jgi:predicted Zn-dependent peptidase